MDQILEKCVKELYDVGVVKFGSFTLKSGLQSPVYFDLRIIVSYPKLMATVSDLLWQTSKKKYDLVCGVAYTGIPLASIIAVKEGVPMILRRKEAKNYGTKQMVEGVFEKGNTCLIVEDVLVSGASVYETVENLRELQLNCTEAVVFLDRQQGGVNNLKKMGITMYPVLTLTKMLDILEKDGRVSTKIRNEVDEFISQHNEVKIKQKFSNGQLENNRRLRASISSRISSSTHPLVARILSLVEEKSSNLCVAADVATSAELLQLAKKLGPHIIALKTHIDIMEDFNDQIARELKEISVKERFLIFEDRKLVDIGSTVEKQALQFAGWADMVTAAPVLGGSGVIRGIPEGLGVVIVSEMSSEGALRSKEYTENSLKMAQEYPKKIMGFVCQSPISDEPSLLQMTPGVSLSAKDDALGQKYTSPKDAVLERGADVIIVGRGIVKASDPVAAAKQYQKIAFDALLERISA